MIESISAVILVIFTAVLAVATIALARYTKTPASLTDQMVRFQEREKGRTDLKKALGVIEAICKVSADEFVAQLAVPGHIPEPVSSYVRELGLLVKYVGDSDNVLYIKQLRQWIDTVQEGTSIGDNGPEIARLFTNVQQRMGWSITEWRNELQA